MNTVVGKPFSDWVRHQIDQRNGKLASDHNLNIELDAEIAAAFRSSSQISSKSNQIPPRVTVDVQRARVSVPIFSSWEPSVGERKLKSLSTKRSKR